jgi:hypothetical protein
MEKEQISEDDLLELDEDFEKVKIDIENQDVMLKNNIK